MPYRPLSLFAGLLALSFSLPAAAAQSGPDEARQADWSKRLERAQTLKKEGGEKKHAAKKLFEARKKACFKKFQVNACQEEAKTEFIQSTNEARRLQNEGQAIEGQVKKEQVADKDAQRRQEAPQREADRRVQEAETAQARSKAENERNKKTADHARKAAEGSQRRAEHAERIREKQERHARKVAEKMEKARRREAEQQSP